MIVNLFIPFVFLFFLLVIFILLVYGGPYVPTKEKVIEKMIKISGIKKNETAVDLGSGDGRIVFRLAERGIKTYGYEINPLLVLLSRMAIRKRGIGDKAFICMKDFWKVNMSRFDVVYIFGINYIMGDLERKLKKELKPGSRVVTHTFGFPSWKSERKEGKVYLYKVKGK